MTSPKASLDSPKLKHYYCKMGNLLPIDAIINASLGFSLCVARSCPSFLFHHHHLFFFFSTAFVFTRYVHWRHCKIQCISRPTNRQHQTQSFECTFRRPPYILSLKSNWCKQSVYFHLAYSCTQNRNLDAIVLFRYTAIFQPQVELNLTEFNRSICVTDKQFVR